ncbi:MAG: alpha/beta hydrolase [Aestuariivirgaceae bacterium]|nr:alpha/beta hydrolase [Aestuariivirgaceae bacterium]
MAKPLFILIPALGCDAGLYEKLIPAMADLVDARVIVPDGNTLALCVSQVLEQAPEHFLIGGTSFGGHVAREVALGAPDRVAGLMIMGAGAGPASNPAGGRKRSERLRGGDHAGLIRDMAETINSPASPESAAAKQAFIRMGLAANPETIARQNDALTIRPDRWKDLEAITCPSLLLWGRDDRYSPGTDGLRMSAAMPNARFVELEDVGHLPSLEAPEEMADAVRHWLMDNI